MSVHTAIVYSPSYGDGVALYERCKSRLRILVREVMLSASQIDSPESISAAVYENHDCFVRGDNGHIIGTDGYPTYTATLWGRRIRMQPC